MPLCLLLIFSSVLETNNINLKCKCFQETFNYLPIHRIEKLQIFPRGHGCPNTEIIFFSIPSNSNCQQKQTICSPEVKEQEKKYPHQSLVRMSCITFTVHIISTIITSTPLQIIRY
ncbi:hypothetical protein FD755_023084 [Muntiacus reevesi]|uniref:Chemokine interleukin-8-like domain-containing protein n=1 Tax=Muntiacus reevesi TaxID=9886 RepID=A0A5N3VYS6_MUNRE|nr:hypothetical protein FD755_023084 [Muntiacus reevesi]